MVRKLLTVNLDDNLTKLAYSFLEIAIDETIMNS